MASPPSKRTRRRLNNLYPPALADSASETQRSQDPKTRDVVIDVRLTGHDVVMVKNQGRQSPASLPNQWQRDSRWGWGWGGVDEFDAEERRRDVKWLVVELDDVGCREKGEEPWLGFGAEEFEMSRVASVEKAV